MNRTAFYLAAIGLSVSLGSAGAEADDDRAAADVMGAQAISQITTFAGYDVVDIDLEDDVYRVEAFEPAGKRVELRYLAEDASLLSVRDAGSRSPFDAAAD